MDERDWKIVTILHEQQNITKASKLLYITQPALSTRIKQIEEDLGIVLLNRGNKGITFTREGETVVEFAHNHLSAMDIFRQQLLSSKPLAHAQALAK